MLINVRVAVISEYPCVLNHHIVHFKKHIVEPLQSTLCSLTMYLFICQSSLNKAGKN